MGQGRDDDLPVKRCTRCDGNGMVLVVNDKGVPEWVRCPRCGGSGYEYLASTDGEEEQESEAVGDD
jgi:DnaJ-class molecular chaperone